MDISKIKDTTEAGEWIKIYMPDGTETDIELLVISYRNKNYNSALRNEMIKHVKTHKNLSDEEALKLSWNEELIENCVKDWKNVWLEGEELGFTKENLKMFLKMVPFVKQTIQNVMMNDNFFIQMQKETLKKP